jgi:murein tripeptide amidase MpaA
MEPPRIAEHLHRFQDAFTWENKGRATEEDRAALTIAAGWCSGWRPFLALFSEPAR